MSDATPGTRFWAPTLLRLGSMTALSGICVHPQMACDSMARRNHMRRHNLRPASDTRFPSQCRPRPFHLFPGWRLDTDIHWGVWAIGLLWMDSGGINILYGLLQIGLSH